MNFYVIYVIVDLFYIRLIFYVFYYVLFAEMELSKKKNSNRYNYDENSSGNNEVSN